VQTIRDGYPTCRSPMDDLTHTDDPNATRPRVVVSRCLGFDTVRYDGERLESAVVQDLVPHVDFITVCPEVDIGMPVPRDPIRVVETSTGRALIQPSTGRDLTEQMSRYADHRLTSFPPVDGFILKSKSPSCGIGDTKVYPNSVTDETPTRGSGFFGAAVLEWHDGIPVETERRLLGTEVREHFLTQIFSIARLRHTLEIGTMSALTEHHTRHNYMLLALDESRHRELGRIVANEQGCSFDDVSTDYERHFRAAFAKPASVSATINVLEHMLGHFNAVGTDEKTRFLDAVNQFRTGHTHIGMPLALLRDWADRHSETYVSQQVLLRPFHESLSRLEYAVPDNG
jgi:uncharacterized protein YbbK (DUF523 family)/uncharacterized protein YbgA (DUF1722 family)